MDKSKEIAPVNESKNFSLIDNIIYYKFSKEKTLSENTTIIPDRRCDCSEKEIKNINENFCIYHHSCKNRNKVTFIVIHDYKKNLMNLQLKRSYPVYEIKTLLNVNDAKRYQIFLLKQKDEENKEYETLLFVKYKSEIDMNWYVVEGYENRYNKFYHLKEHNFLMLFNNFEIVLEDFYNDSNYISKKSKSGDIWIKEYLIHFVLLLKKEYKSPITIIANHLKNTQYLSKKQKMNVNLFCEEYQKFIITLFYVFQKTGKYFISNDVLIFKILPHILEPEVYLSAETNLDIKLFLESKKKFNNYTDLYRGTKRVDIEYVKKKVENYFSGNWHFPLSITKEGALFEKNKKIKFYQRSYDQVKFLLIVLNKQILLKDLNTVDFLDGVIIKNIIPHFNKIVDKSRLMLKNYPYSEKECSFDSHIFYLFQQNVNAYINIFLVFLTGEKNSNFLNDMIDGTILKNAIKIKRLSLEMRTQILRNSNLFVESGSGIIELLLKYLKFLIKNIKLKNYSLKVLCIEKPYLFESITLIFKLFECFIINSPKNFELFFFKRFNQTFNSGMNTKDAKRADNFFIVNSTLNKNEFVEEMGMVLLEIISYFSKKQKEFLNYNSFLDLKFRYNFDHQRTARALNDESINKLYKFMNSGCEVIFNYLNYCRKIILENYGCKVNSKHFDELKNFKNTLFNKEKFLIKFLDILNEIYFRNFMDYNFTIQNIGVVNIVTHRQGSFKILNILRKTSYIFFNDVNPNMLITSKILKESEELFFEIIKKYDFFLIKEDAMKEKLLSRSSNNIHYIEWLSYLYENEKFIIPSSIYEYSSGLDFSIIYKKIMESIKNQSAYFFDVDVINFLKIIHSLLKRNIFNYYVTIDSKLKQNKRVKASIAKLNFNLFLLLWKNRGKDNEETNICILILKNLIMIYENAYFDEKSRDIELNVFKTLKIFKDYFLPSICLGGEFNKFNKELFNEEIKFIKTTQNCCFQLIYYAEKMLNAMKKVLKSMNSNSTMGLKIIESLFKKYNTFFKVSKIIRNYEKKYDQITHLFKENYESSIALSSDTFNIENKIFTILNTQDDIFNFENFNKYKETFLSYSYNVDEKTEEKEKKLLSFIESLYYFHLLLIRDHSWDFHGKEKNDKLRVEFSNFMIEKFPTIISEFINDLYEGLEIIKFSFFYKLQFIFYEILMRIIMELYFYNYAKENRFYHWKIGDDNGNEIRYCIFDIILKHPQIKVKTKEILDSLNRIILNIHKNKNAFDIFFGRKMNRELLITTFFDYFKNKKLGDETEITDQYIISSVLILFKNKFNYFKFDYELNQICDTSKIIASLLHYQKSPPLSTNVVKIYDNLYQRINELLYYLSGNRDEEKYLCIFLNLLIEVFRNKISSKLFVKKYSKMLLNVIKRLYFTPKVCESLFIFYELLFKNVTKQELLEMNAIEIVEKIFSKNISTKAVKFYLTIDVDFYSEKFLLLLLKSIIVTPVSKIDDEIRKISKIILRDKILSQDKKCKQLLFIKDQILGYYENDFHFEKNLRTLLTEGDLDDKEYAKFIISKVKEIYDLKFDIISDKKVNNFNFSIDFSIQSKSLDNEKKSTLKKKKINATEVLSHSERKLLNKPTKIKRKIKVEEIESKNENAFNFDFNNVDFTYDNTFGVDENEKQKDDDKKDDDDDSLFVF